MVSVVSPSAGGVRPSQLQSIQGGHALSDQAQCRHPQRPTCPPHLVRFGIDLGNDCAGMPATTSMLAHQRLADVEASLFAESRHLGNRYSLTLRVVSFDAPASQHLSACLLPTAKHAGGARRCTGPKRPKGQDNRPAHAIAAGRPRKSAPQAACTPRDSGRDLPVVRLASHCHRSSPPPPWRLQPAPCCRMHAWCPRRTCRDDLDQMEGQWPVDGGKA